MLATLLRAGMHPTGGGCLCGSGDCPHCLATVDGVAYTRTCLTPARDGMVVRRDHAHGATPPLLAEKAGGAGAEATDNGEGTPRGKEARAQSCSAGKTRAAATRRGTETVGEPSDHLEPAAVRHVHCDTVVVGQGRSGRKAAEEARAAGQEVVTLDDGHGQHVTGVYPGPLVVALDRDGRVLHVHPRQEIVIATGAAEIQPVAPGSDLEGLATSRGAHALAAAGIDLGRVLRLSTEGAVDDAPERSRPASGTAFPDHERIPARDRQPKARPDSGNLSEVSSGTLGLPEGVSGRLINLNGGGWEIDRFEGKERLEAVVLVPHGMAEEVAAADPDRRAQAEFRVECDTAILDLGRQPRTALARMASDLPVRVVGGAAQEPDELPPCPREGVVCPCSGVTLADLDDVWRRGFREMELLKRATLAGTGACQGGACLPHLRSFLLERGGRLQPAFTARPLNRQLTVRELAAGAHTPATARSPLHDEHLRLCARMDRAGGWWRPSTYGNGPAGGSDGRSDDEYRAVRERVSLGDVSSLGKFVIAGPDAEAFLERIVPTRVATIRPGRCRYMLMLDERGHVLDDGMICRDEDPPGLNQELAAGRDSARGLVSRSSETVGERFFMTSTSGGSTFLEAWLRDWAESFCFEVHILNQTTSLAAINVTGPLAARLLARAGAAELPPFGRQRRVEIAGIDCRVLRLSFTGELSYELHHAAADSVALWRRLLRAGAPFDVHPHGLEALLRLRLEKGHLVVGQDTDFDSTPRRLRHEWAVDMAKRDFIGRQAILRTNRRPLDRALVALEMTDPPSGLTARFLEGAAIHDGDRYAGHVTSAGDRGAATGAGGESRHDPGPGVAMLGWLHVDAHGNLPREVTVAGRPARRVDRPLHDPRGRRARVKIDLTGASPVPANQEVRQPGGEGPWQLRQMDATRIAASPAALDRFEATAPWHGHAVTLRTAADELMLTAPPTTLASTFASNLDPHAVVERETGFRVAWLEREDTERLLERACDWEPPGARPALAQGEVAGVPVKLRLQADGALLLVPVPFATAFERRMKSILGGAA